MHRHSRVWLPIVLVFGCSDDPAPAVDGPGSAGSDANNEAMCLVKANHGNVGSLQGTSTLGPTTLSVVLDPGPPRDNFFINLKDAAPATGTFEITGANASGATCTVCLSVLADIVAMQGSTKFYFANSGSVTLTATNPPAGTLTNVTFVETSANGTPTNSGCTSRIEAMSFGP